MPCGAEKDDVLAQGLLIAMALLHTNVFSADEEAFLSSLFSGATLNRRPCCRLLTELQAFLQAAQLALLQAELQAFCR